MENVFFFLGTWAVGSTFSAKDYNNGIFCVGVMYSGA
jgi:hypothetical protein